MICFLYSTPNALSCGRQLKTPHAIPQPSNPKCQILNPLLRNASRPRCVKSFPILPPPVTRTRTRTRLRFRAVLSQANPNYEVLPAASAAATQTINPEKRPRKWQKEACRSMLRIMSCHVRCLAVAIAASPGPVAQSAVM